MITLSERIAQDGITADVAVGDGTPRWASRTFTVTLHRPIIVGSQVTAGRTEITVPFGQGSSGHPPADSFTEPTAHDVLTCLLSDAASVLNADDFDGWADEYGFPMETARERREARATYDACTEQTEELRAFLGDAFDAYVWETAQD